MFRGGAAFALVTLLALMGGNGPARAQQDGVGSPVDEDAPSQTQPAPAPTEMPTSIIESPPNAASAAPAPILTIDQDVLFASSAWGKRTQAVLDAEGNKIVAENDRMATQLSNEEAQLTQERVTLEPAEFRRRAEAFDTRATEVRRERAQAVQDLNAWAEADRAAFYRAALPVMGEMMKERGAVAVLDRRTVFVSLDAIDMTRDLVIAADASLGDGEGVVPFPLPQQVEQEDAPQDTPQE